MHCTSDVPSADVHNNSVSSLGETAKCDLSGLTCHIFDPLSSVESIVKLCSAVLVLLPYFFSSPGVAGHVV